MVTIKCPLCKKELKFNSFRKHIINLYCPEVKDSEIVNEFLNAWKQFLKEMKKKTPITAQDHKYMLAEEIVHIYKKGKLIVNLLITFVDNEGNKSQEIVEAKEFLQSKRGKQLLNTVYYNIKKKFVIQLK